MSEDISNAVAIVGIACKFPKSNNLEDYWENIKNGTECLETLSQEELEQAGIDAATIQNKNYVKRSSYIEDVDKFDADFFYLYGPPAETSIRESLGGYGGCRLYSGQW